MHFYHCQDIMKNDNLLHKRGFVDSLLQTTACSLLKLLFHFQENVEWKCCNRGSRPRFYVCRCNTGMIHKSPKGKINVQVLEVDSVNQFFIQEGIYVLSSQNQVALREKNSRPKLLFLRLDSCQNRAQRGFGSPNQQKSRGQEFFSQRCNRFLAAKIHFLC